MFSQTNRGFKKADRILEKLVKRKKVPGVAISVSKKGAIVFSKGFGYANLTSKEPIIPSETIFRIGSVSKPIAASGLAKMVADKQIDIHKSIYDYIPYFPKKRYDFTLK